MLQLGVVVSIDAATSLTTYAQCTLDWSAGFELPGINGEVAALAIFDDGSGPALYAGGRFSTAGNASVNYIAQWDGSTWSPLGTGVSGPVLTMTVFNDGSSEALYVGGAFETAGGVAANSIAKWDGKTWSPLGDGMGGGLFYDTVDALAVFDDGQGSALYAGGDFTTAGSVQVNYAAKWDGANWSVLGTGLSDEVRALAVYNDGSGPALYAGGLFAFAGDVPTNRIAKWSGTTWAPVGGGLDGRVHALAVADVGGGPALFAGGDFTTAGSVSARHIAKWNGTTWAPLGNGMNGFVFGLARSSAGLLAAGAFTTAGGVPARGVALWNGATWSAVGEGVYEDTGRAYVRALAVADGQDGESLYIGGAFTRAAKTAASAVAVWDGVTWSALGRGHGVSGPIHALAVYDDGTGGALYAGGRFAMAGDTLVSGVARWNGAFWSPVGSGVGGFHVVPVVYALSVFDDGTGPALYAGGRFHSAGGTPAGNIARWDGSTWSRLADGVDGDVYALAVHDDGAGPALYVGGRFTRAGGVPVVGLARWDGVAWSPVGSGPGSTAVIHALAPYDDGAGAALYAGGVIVSGNPPATVASYLAKWDGANWSRLSSDVAGPTWPAVYALRAFDDGSGPQLYVGGHFTTAGSIAAKYVARWNGQTWSPVGNGMTGADPDVHALGAWNNGYGATLFAGGSFQRANGVLVNGIAEWDANWWYALDGGLASDIPDLPVVYSLASFDDGKSPALYVGGAFATAGGKPAAHLAKWSCPFLRGDLNCDGKINFFDIDPFVLALTNPGKYAQKFPNCDRLLADINGDGKLNNFDIDPFVELLTP